MSMIVAGKFDSKARADAAIGALVAGGIKSDHILCSVDLAGSEESVVGRSIGILVAVATPTESACALAADVLRRHGAYSVAETAKSLRSGKWVALEPVPLWHAGQKEAA